MAGPTPEEVASPGDDIIAAWIANDEWLYHHHTKMTRREIAAYVALRLSGVLSEPTVDRPWASPTS